MTTYIFTEQDEAYSWAPTITIERGGVQFYIAAAEQCGEFEVGCTAYLTPLVTIQELTAEAAAEMLPRVFGLPAVPSEKIEQLKQEAIKGWTN